MRSSLCHLATVLLIAIASSALANAEGPAGAPEGFQPLFDGRTLDGWHGGTTQDPRTVTPEQQQSWDEAVPRHWRVEGGELINDGQEPHLVTKAQYGDFELWVDWKLAPNGDSGIYLRDAPQVQLWDPTNPAEQKNGAAKGSGALWNNAHHERFPSVIADEPIGKWNHMYVRIVGELVKVVLNGKTVVDNVPLENYFDSGSPLFPRGAIHLQTHGSETRFRNVFAREIPHEEADRILAEAAGGDTGFKPLFNGKNLSGWIGALDSYEAAGGVIHAKPGGSGNLLTKDQYDDFVVRFDFRLPPAGNNGLAIRTSGPDVDAAYEGVELQILDDGDPKYADLHDYQAHGSAYGLAPAHRGFLRPTGQWNFEEVTVEGDHVQVGLNGFSILDVHLDEAVKAPLDGKAHPGAARRSGYVGFCGHGDAVEFRDIRIKRLTAK